MQLVTSSLPASSTSINLCARPASPSLPKGKSNNAFPNHDPLTIMSVSCRHAKTTPIRYKYIIISILSVSFFFPESLLRYFCFTDSRPLSCQHELLIKGKTPPTLTA
jgi:hypothetical protein